MERVDKVVKWQDPTYFVSKLPYWQMPDPQIWSVCQPVLALSRLQVLAQNLYNPIEITLGYDFYENPSVPDKGKHLPDKGIYPLNIIKRYIWQSADFLTRISRDVGQNISASATILDVRHLSVVGEGPKSKAFFVDSLNASSEFSSAL